MAIGRPSFCSNDYLALAAQRGSGAGASRLIAGELPAHAALEVALAEWLRAPATLLFSSGYAANVGVLAALAEPGDLLVSDELNHASIVDGCRLARAEIVVTPHLDLSRVAEVLARPCSGRKWVVTESYFSMDADSPDLRALRALCDAAGAALIVDEAHALGVFGPQGRGLCAEAGIVPDVLVGALGKAFGVAGAFAGGSNLLVDWLWNRARSFVFSTGVSPLVASAASAALETVAEGEALRTRLHGNARSLRQGLDALDLRCRGFGPIIPVIVGDARMAVEAANELTMRGVTIPAVRPPTVPPNSARLRVTVTASHTDKDIRALVDAFREVLPWLHPSS
jgi:8-amino-7-oxononanoate synthase